MTELVTPPRHPGLTSRALREQFQSLEVRYSHDAGSWQAEIWGEVESGADGMNLPTGIEREVRA